MNFTIRLARPQDFTQLKPMLLDMQFIDGEKALEERFPSFCGRDNASLWVADEEGRLLGYAHAQDYGPHLRSGNKNRTAKLNDLYGLPEVRKRGVGRALMQEAETWAKSRGLRYLFWCANVREATHERGS